MQLAILDARLRSGLAARPGNSNRMCALPKGPLASRPARRGVVVRADFQSASPTVSKPRSGSDSDSEEASTGWERQNAFWQAPRGYKKAVMLQGERRASTGPDDVSTAAVRIEGGLAAYRPHTLWVCSQQCPGQCTPSPTTPHVRTLGCGGPTRWCSRCPLPPARHATPRHSPAPSDARLPCRLR